MMNILGRFLNDVFDFDMDEIIIEVKFEKYVRLWHFHS